MTLRERRRALRAKLTTQLKAARARTRAKLASDPRIQRERRRRRIRNAVIAAVAILIACLVRCDCGAGKPKPVPQARAVPEVMHPPVKKPSPKLKSKVQAHLATQDRGAYVNGSSQARAWIDEFRLQVGARSPELARCFAGEAHPGALRWTSSVDPKSGTVADDELEPIGASDPLTRLQRTCLLGALHAPHYRFESLSTESLPSRVSIVIEF